MSAPPVLAAPHTEQLAIPVNGRMVEMGKIKTGCKGEKKTSGNGKEFRVPQKLDHFIVTTLTRGDDENFIPDVKLMADLVEEVGDPDGRIRRLPISLLSSDVDQIVQRRYLWFLGQKKAGESDGKTLSLYYHPRTKKLLDKPMILPWQPETGEANEDVQDLVNVEKAFKLHTTFNCMIRSQHARFGGVYKFRSTGVITANQIPSSLMVLKELTGGFLRMLPMELVIRPTQVCPMVNGVPTPSTVYVVHVEMMGFTIEGIRQLASEQMNRELADLQATRRAQLEYRRLILSPNFLDSDLEPEEVEARPLPQLSGGVPPPPPPPPPPTATLAELHAVALRAAVTLEELGSAYGDMTVDWKKFDSEERKMLNAVVAEQKAKLTKASGPDPVHDEAAFVALLLDKKKDRNDVYAWLHEQTGEPEFHPKTPWLGIEEKQRRMIVDLLNGKLEGAK